MDKIDRQVAIARNRLILAQFGSVLPWCLFSFLLLATLGILTPKIWSLGVDGQTWMWSWIGGGILAGFLAAGMWTAFHHCTTLEAAIELDRRFHLQERISTMFALGGEQLETKAGQALVQDALRSADRIDVREQFALSIGRRAWLPLLPATLAFCVALLLQDKGFDTPAVAKPPAASDQQVKNSADALRRKLAERRKQAEAKGLKNTQALLQNVEENAKQLGKKGQADRKKAMMKLNDLAKDLEQRRQALGGAEQIRQQLKQMDHFGDGPAEKLAQAMRDGDAQQAIEALKKLQEQLKNESLHPAAQQQLADQLEQMQKTLQQAADSHQKAMSDLAQRIEQSRAQGDLQQADRLQQQLDKLAQQAQPMEQFNKMAQQMAQACKACQTGNSQQAAQALSEMAQNIEGMQQRLDELEVLDQALGEIRFAKSAMGCKQCDGAGCEACTLPGGSKPGTGHAPGRGNPPGLKDGQFYNSQVRQSVGKGSAVVTGMADGPNIKGRVLEGIKQEQENSRRAAPDSLTDQQLPRTHRQHAQEYFDAFREKN